MDQNKHSSAFKQSRSIRCLCSGEDNQEREQGGVDMKPLAHRRYPAFDPSSTSNERLSIQKGCAAGVFEEGLCFQMEACKACWQTSSNRDPCCHSIASSSLWTLSDSTLQLVLLRDIVAVDNVNQFRGASRSWIGKGTSAKRKNRLFNKGNFGLHSEPLQSSFRFAVASTTRYYLETK